MKKVLILGLVAMSSLFANAAYMYWTIEKSYTWANTGATYTWTEDDPAKPNTYQAGRVNAVDSSGVIQQSSAKYVYDGEGAQVYKLDLSTFGSDYANYSYSVELLAYTTSGWSQVGATQIKTYTDLVNSGVVLTGSEQVLTPPTLATVTSTWHGTGVNAPEPTSGILVILGAALMGLKRKARKEA